MTTDTLTDHDIAAAFTDVAREWKGVSGDAGGEVFSRLYDEKADDFVRAVEARAAQYAERPADSLVIETDWNNLDARGVIRQTGVGMPQVWARDGDEEVLIVGYAVDWSTQRPALRGDAT